MSFLSEIDNVNESDKSAAVKQLITQSTPDFDFFFLIVLSVLMATFGLLTDSVSIVIGSMLIAPILSPILSISLGLVMSDGKLLFRSLYTVLKASLLGIVSAMLVTFLFKGVIGSALSSEILARTEPSLIYFLVAVISGFAVSYTLVKPGLSATLPGIAVAVALIPPLAVIGIGIATLEGAVVSGSLMLYIINVIGIVFASVVSFSLMNLYGKRRVAETTIKKEDERLKIEQKEAQKLKEKAQNSTL